MSATGRKRKDAPPTERREADFYPTPAWCVTRLLQHVELPGGFWLEPSAGDGAIIRAVASVRHDVKWTAVEIRREAIPALCRTLLDTDPHAPVAALQSEDYLARRMPDLGDLAPGDLRLFRVALGNPPFMHAAHFVLNALQECEQVVMLLRLNFLGSSNDRRHLFEQAGMPDVYVLPERPSFTGEGTDACEYAWMRWIRGKRQKSEVRILFDTQQTAMFGEP